MAKRAKVSVRSKKTPARTPARGRARDAHREASRFLRVSNGTTKLINVYVRKENGDREHVGTIERGQEGDFDLRRTLRSDCVDAVFFAYKLDRAGDLYESASSFAYDPDGAKQSPVRYEVDNAGLIAGPLPDPRQTPEVSHGAALVHLALSSMMTGRNLRVVNNRTIDIDAYVCKSPGVHTLVGKVLKASSKPFSSFLGAGTCANVGFSYMVGATRVIAANSFNYDSTVDKTITYTVRADGKIAGPT